jgi:rifampin ADP-ribosyltransferase
VSASDNLNEKQFYHGTNRPYASGDVIDPREKHDRVHNISQSDRVYMTTDPARASFYADKAADKFGGEPKVFKVEPTGPYNQDTQTLRTPENKTTKHPVRVVAEHPYTDWKAAHHER